MIAPTHSAFGILLSSLLLQTLNPAILLVAGAAALLPDIDQTHSTAGRILFPISGFISGRFTHRTITHSWVAVLVAVASAAILSVFYPICASSALIGFLSGILGDMLTKSGVNFVYPAKVAVIIFRNPALRFKTGSVSELVLLAFIFFGSIGVFNLHSQGGLVKIYETYLGSVNSAVAFYNNNYNQNIIRAKIVGYRSSDRLPINQDYRVIKADGNLFYLQDDAGYIYRAATSGEVEIVIDKIRLGNTFKASVATKTIQFSDELVTPKINSLQLGDENYFFGQLASEDLEDLNLPKSDKYLWPVLVEGNNLKLQGARLKQLESIENVYCTGELILIKINY